MYFDYTVRTCWAEAYVEFDSRNWPLVDARKMLITADAQIDFETEKFGP